MREYTKWDVLFVLWLFALGAIVMWAYMGEREVDAKNDLCIEAGGVYVRTYDGYKCYSMDFREELKIGE